MTEVVERVSELERMIKDLVYVQRQTEMKLASFIEEIREDTRKFKEEMKEFKEFTEKNIDSLNQKWGELANRLGTIAEDLIMPCFPETVEKYLGLKNPMTIHLNTTVRKEGKAKEFGIIIIYDDVVILNEVKATATNKSVQNFVDFIQSDQFFHYFPHLKEKKLIPFLSAMKFAEGVLEILTKNKIYAVTPCPDMKIINFDKLH
ncbi:MAG: hypothetical protein D6732_02360 [Methanobacteriota archaeon]|nr:MAG: hypothetical protein D6732_02360 [Euryarchaeota archaeon]